MGEDAGRVRSPDWACQDCDWRGFVGAALRHERRTLHRVRLIAPARVSTP